VLCMRAFCETGSRKNRRKPGWYCTKTSSRWTSS